MARRNATNSDIPELSDQQDQAIKALLSGQTCEAAATTAGVTRQTVSGWLNHDAKFIQALRLRRKELWNAHIDRLRGLLFTSLATLEEDLNGEDIAARREAARFIVKNFSTDLAREIEPMDSTGRDSIMLEIMRL